MGIMRETDTQEMDIVKEMAESLGSQGIRIDEILENINVVGARLNEMLAMAQEAPVSSQLPSLNEIDLTIRKYNTLVDKAHEALRWLLIQREACGFRKHKDVHLHYPIPPKVKPPKL
jgi:hypothetical protein